MPSLCHKDGIIMPGKKNILTTVELTISTNQPLVDQLEKLVASGLYGKNSAAAAERLISKGIHDLQREGLLLSPKKQKGNRRPTD
jgi:hypothetical protein